MPYKNREDHRQACRDHYARNADQYKDRVVRRRAQIRKFVISLKEGRSCVRCKQSFHHKAMDFHHRDPSTKEFCIATAAIRGMSENKILMEVDKCDLLCAVCHRIEN